MMWPAAVIFALSSACSSSDSSDAEPSDSDDTEQAGVTMLTGTWKMPGFVGHVFSDRAVTLTDLSAFVRREPGRALPNDSTISRSSTDANGLETFGLRLPLEPAGESHRFSGTSDAGVKIFSLTVGFSFGDAFAQPLELSGWPSELTSVVTEPGTREVIGGRIAVWSPDGAAFATGFGADGRLFTADDPLSRLESGWTVVDLDAAPFVRLRDASAAVNILNGDAERDLSANSFTGAFDRLTAELAVRYPFTQVKALDWSGIRDSVRPFVVAAEAAGDADAFGAALTELALLTKDGHVAADPAPVPQLLERYGAGFGLRLGEDDDGAVFAIEVADGSPAAAAGIEAGAEIVRWNGAPVARALGETELALSASSPHGVRAQQLDLLSRASLGSELNVAYRNPAASADSTATLDAIDDLNGFFTAFHVDQTPTLPVIVNVLPSGIGYVRITTFGSDASLLTSAWEAALEQLIDLEVPALIVDVRGNPGGASQVGAYMAGSFFAEPYLRSQRFGADPQGHLVWNGDDVIRPAPVQWQQPVAVLIDGNCMSVCEEFVVALSVDPSHAIVGSSNTAGVEADVRFWALPGDLVFQSPLAQFRHPNGELFVEGMGVAPSVRVAVTRESLLSPEDEVLDAAVAQLASAAE